MDWISVCRTFVSSATFIFQISICLHYIHIFYSFGGIQLALMRSRKFDWQRSCARLVEGLFTTSRSWWELPWTKRIRGGKIGYLRNIDAVKREWLVVRFAEYLHVPFHDSQQWPGATYIDWCDNYCRCSLELGIWFNRWSCNFSWVSDPLVSVF